MKVFSITTGKSRIEFGVYKTMAGYEARVNDMVIYKSESYSVCSEVINESAMEEEINVLRFSGVVH